MTKTVEKTRTEDRGKHKNEKKRGKIIERVFCFPLSARGRRRNFSLLSFSFFFFLHPRLSLSRGCCRATRAPPPRPRRLGAPSIPTSRSLSHAPVDAPRHAHTHNTRNFQTTTKNNRWNFTPSPGWTADQAATLKLCLMRLGVGRWVQIQATGLLPGKMVQQLNGQTQRLLGQQSLAAYTGLQVREIVGREWEGERKRRRANRRRPIRALRRKKTRPRRRCCLCFDFLVSHPPRITHQPTQPTRSTSTASAATTRPAQTPSARADSSSGPGPTPQRP